MIILSAIITIWECKLEYQKFLELYKSGVIKVHVNKYDAKQLLTTDIMPKKYVYSDIVWSWIWLLSLPVGISLIIWVNRIIGVIICFLFFFIHNAQRQSAAQFVIEYAQEDESFYNFVVDQGIMEIDITENINDDFESGV